MVQRRRTPNHEQLHLLILRVSVVMVAATVMGTLMVTGAFPSIAATKPAFSCPNAPAKEVRITSRADAEQAALRLDGASRQLWRAGKEWKQGRRPDQLAVVRARLAERKDALVRTMRLDPDAAVPALLTGAERTELGPTASNCLESWVTLEGTLRAQQYDTLDAEGSRLEYTLTTDRKQAFTVYPANADQAELIPGSRVRIDGYQIGSEILFNAAPLEEAAADPNTGRFATLAAPAAAPATQYRVAVLLAHYSDVTQPVTPTAQSMTTMMSNVDVYFQENSYGAVGFASDVFGWYQLPLTEAECAYENVLDAAMVAADPEVNWTQYTNVMVVIRGTPTCPYSGLAYLGPVNYTTADGTVSLAPTWISTVLDWVVGHELGHNLGNHHASYLPCDPPIGTTSDPACWPVEYGDPYSVMGNIGFGHFTAKHKDLSGFFAPGMLQTVTTGPNDYVLEPIETATGGLKSVRVIRGVSGGDYDYLYAEYRRPLGVDASLNTQNSPGFYDGAQLHVSGSTAQHSGLFDPVRTPVSVQAATLPVGSTYTDAQSGVKVQTLGQTDDAIAVRVTPGRTEWTAPTVQITSPVSNATYSGNLPVTANITDATGIEKVEFRVGYLNAQETPFAIFTTGPFTANLDTTQLPNGRNWITVTAYDTAGDAYGTTGNVRSIPRGFYVDNAGATPITVALTAPVEGASFIGPAAFTAVPSYAIGVWKVEFYVDGSATASTIDASVPYSATVALADGVHTAIAAAYDFAGTRYDSPSVSFTVLPDVASPIVTLNAPTNGASVGGIIPIDFSWSDDSGALSVAYLVVDGATASQDLVAPFELWWDTRGYADGSHTVAVWAGDPSSRTGYSATATVTVDNTGPTVAVIDPVGGASVSGFTTITATASHAAGIGRVDLYYDGVRLIGTDTSAPYSVSWDPIAVLAGAHTLTARAVNAYGIAAISTAVAVTLVDPTAPDVVNNLSAGSP